MFSFCLFIFHFCFAAATSSDGDKVRAHFFDVGQGHCFLFVVKNTGFNDIRNPANDPADVVILIDAGSTSDPKYVPTQTSIKSEYRQNEIRSEIKRYIGLTTKVLIIVTHGDKDHYNWMKNILTEPVKTTHVEYPRSVGGRPRDCGVTVELRPIFSPENLLCVLGGQAKDYKNRRGDSELPNFITRQHSSFVLPTAVVVPISVRVVTSDVEESLTDVMEGGVVFCDNVTRLGSIDEINTRIRNYLREVNVSVTILSAGEETQADVAVSTEVDDEDRKNKSSLVTQVEYIPSKISFMITGDAPGSITDQIIRQHTHTLDALQSTVLLASHHGATTHGSNNEEWFGVVKPQYIVLSHGDQATFKHPHFDAVRCALNSAQGASSSCQPHVLFCGPRRGVQIVESGEKMRWQYNMSDVYAHSFVQCCLDPFIGCQMLLTNCNVFSTYTQGDILFIINGHGVMNSPPVWNKRVGNELSNDLPSIIQGYLQGTELVKSVMNLNFSGFPQLAAAFLALNMTPAQMPYLSEVDFTGISIIDDVTVSSSTAVENATLPSAVATVPVIGILRSHIDRLKTAFASQRRFIAKGDITVSDAVDDAV